VAAENYSNAKLKLENLEQNGANSAPDVGTRANGRPRSPTILKLQWLGERLRKVERIKKQVAAGTYHVDSESIARAMLSLDQEDEGK
jgi:anti-sigma28 factor (negative regulator of flagellin synthesis)